jgi:hypothetical protein
LLQKLDFWLRNPDYFSNMLLDRYDQSHEPWLLETAREVMNSREPDLRRYPMLRYRFGAYEPLDDALAVLAAPGLVVRRRDGTAAHTRQHVYYLTAKGRETAELVISDAPALKYYVDRVAVLVRATRGQGGTELKDEQYRQPEYANTAYNDRIGPITERVRERIDTYREGTP